MGCAVVIDVFRAFSTACYVLDRGPSDYFLVATSDVAERLARRVERPLLIGKPERGASFVYDLPNSPTRSLEVDVPGRTVIHRTEAGARGILAARGDMVLAAAFVNARATVRCLRRAGRASISLFPMGFEGATPSLEDDLCAALILAHLRGEAFAIAEHIDRLRRGPGRYFFGADQQQYPREDFDRCVASDVFEFAVRAECLGDHARLTRC